MDESAAERDPRNLPRRKQPVYTACITSPSARIVLGQLERDALRLQRLDVHVLDGRTGVP